MRLLALALAALFVCIGPTDAQAHDKLMKVGIFKIDGTTKKQSFILDDGNFYKPTSDYQQKKTTDWQLGDSILVLSNNHANHFVLVNSRTNQKVRAKTLGTHLLKVGNFQIDASGRSESFLLSDGNLYKPTSEYQERKTLDWQLGDNILVLASRHANRFLLVNTGTNEKVIAKVIDE